MLGLLNITKGVVGEIAASLMQQTPEFNSQNKQHDYVSAKPMSAGLQKISRIINRVVASDPAATQRLQELGNLCLALQCEQPKTRFDLRVQQVAADERQFVIEQSSTEQAYDIAVKGSSINLLKFIIAASQDKHWDDTQVSVEGDAGKLISLARFFSQLDIDIAELLAPYLGDIPAELLVSSIGRSSQFLSQQQHALSDTVQRLSRDWLSTSASPLATQTELLKTKTELRQFKYDIDRVEAKIRVLKHRLNTDQSIG